MVLVNVPSCGTFLAEGACDGEGDDGAEHDAGKVEAGHPAPLRRRSPLGQDHHDGREGHSLAQTCELDIDPRSPF